MSTSIPASQSAPDMAPVPRPHHPLDIRVLVTTDAPPSAEWDVVVRRLLGPGRTPPPPPTTPKPAPRPQPSPEPPIAARWSDPMDPVDDAEPEDFDAPQRPRRAGKRGKP